MTSTLFALWAFRSKPPCARFFLQTGANGCYVTYIVSGNGFMYNMVRILMGTLLDIGAHRLPEDAMEQALKSGCRGDLGPTAPAHGLTLWRVTYPDFDTEAHLPYGF